MASQVFEVPDAGGNVVLGLLLLIPVALSVVLAALFWPRPLRLEVTSHEVKVSGSIYGRTLSRGDLELEAARAVDLRREPALIPVRRSNGVSLASHQVGWFRLRNGQRALCFLTRRDSVVYLPTKANFVLLLSTSEPDQLLAALSK